MEKAIITARGLGCQIGARFLLKDINWEIEDKSRWIIIGMNGSGKTTLLSILSGYQAYNHGELRYRGTSYQSQDVFDIRKEMGWISNSFFDQVYHYESVLDILLAGLSGTYGIEEKMVRNCDILKAKRLLSYMGLEDRLDAPFNWLSKGERQSVLIARALLAEPNVLVFDEPLTGLDVMAREKMMHFIKSLADQGQHTMIYVTHHFDEISPELFDHCLLLKNGQIYRKGLIEEVFQENVISAFLGVPVQLEQREGGYYSLAF